MSKGFFNVPVAVNEPVLGYAPGSQERRELQSMLKELRSREVDLPMVIGGKEVRTGKLERIFPPHEIAHTLGYYHQGDAGHVKMAIDAALSAREAWAALSWQHRASIFLKAADLLAGPYRAKMNAATILGQSKMPSRRKLILPVSLPTFSASGFVK